MNVKSISGVLFRVIFSVVFAGIFYTCWMAVAIPAFRSGLSIVLKAVIWLAAPVVTALGFTTGVFIFELLSGARKSKFFNIFKWSLIGCAIGAGSVVWFGPMLIVFGMFLIGTASIALREIVRIKRKKT
jgi:hypothetical protein